MSTPPRNKPTSWNLGPRGEGYVVAQIILFALVVLGPRRVSSLGPWGPPWDRVGVGLGLLLGLVGGALALAGVLNLGTNLTVVPRPKESASLVQTGAYRLVRHPIYSGIILAAFGWALLVNGTLSLLYAALLFILFDVKSRREEQWLREKYGEYADYQRRVRKLIPFIY